MQSIICKRRFITLIELMIVMAIIAVTAGVVAVNINKLVAEQRFKNEANLVLDQIRLAQNLMIVLGTDVHVIFSKDPQKEGFRYRLKFDEQLSKDWNRELARVRPNLQEIKSILFEDELQLPSKSGVVDLKFLSGGSVMSKGILRLSTSDNKDDPSAFVRYICLSGYPRPITLDEISDTQETCKRAFDPSQTTKMTQYTTQDIVEKLQSREISNVDGKK